MTDTNTEQVEVTTNALEMSDEDFATLNFDSLTDVEVESPENVSEEVLEDTATDVQDEEEDTIEDVSEPSEDIEEDVSEEEEKGADNEDTDLEESDSDQIDYEAEYKKLLAPFKANGKEIQVDNVEDAITLMQMGANYNKKMAGLKPNLKLLKMLENNGLLEESKLSYLIDLDKKDPKAINRLIKESGVDPLELDVDAASEYTPNTYTVDDKVVDLDGILEEIKDTNSFNTTIDIISNKWDNSSKQVLLDQPDIIKVLNDHVDSGIYQQINRVIESERMLGRLNGVSDIVAYKQVGEMLSANGKLSTTQPNIAEQEPKSVPTKKTVDPMLRNRKKAASSTKSASNKVVEKEFNPLSLSDEDFDKMALNKFI